MPRRVNRPNILNSIADSMSARNEMIAQIDNQRLDHVPGTPPGAREVRGPPTIRPSRRVGVHRPKIAAIISPGTETVDNDIVDPDYVVLGDELIAPPTVGAVPRNIVVQQDPVSPRRYVHINPDTFR